MMTATHRLTTRQLTSCNKTSLRQSTCTCHYAVSIDWYPCSLRFCKYSNGASYKCGIKTCGQTRVYEFPVKDISNCWWDRWNFWCHTHMYTYIVSPLKSPTMMEELRLIAVPTVQRSATKLPIPWLVFSIVLKKCYSFSACYLGVSGQWWWWCQCWLWCNSHSDTIEQLWQWTKLWSWSDRDLIYYLV